MAKLHGKFGVHRVRGVMAREPESLDQNAPTLDFFERLGCGCIVIDASGRVLKTNDYARRCLGPGIAIRNGRLIAADPTCDDELQKLMAALLTAAPRAKRHPEAVVFCHANGHRFVVQAEPVDGPVPTAYAGARGLIRIIDLDDTTEIPLPDILQTVFDLTPAEAKVAQRIACGDAPEQIAESHKVSLGTVREQLKAVFHKTHTNRQAQLVSLLARLGRLGR